MGCLSRASERESSLDLFADVVEDLLELLVRRLLEEDVERADYGEAGVDHVRELPREDDEVAELMLWPTSVLGQVMLLSWPILVYIYLHYLHNTQCWAA